VQLDILLSLYRYRFGTTELLAVDLGKKDRSFIYPRLVTLADQEYIARRFDDSYKLRGKHASYFVLPKGLKALHELRDRDDIDDKSIKASYRDKSTVADDFIEHCLTVYSISNMLRALYPTIDIYTKRELAIYNYFPKKLPDLYIALVVGGDVRRYLLDYTEANTPSFVIDRWARGLINHWQDGAWQAEGDPYPPILCICENVSLEKRLRKRVAAVLNRDDTTMLFYTTTMPALLASTRQDDAIWSSVTEPDALYSLDNLS
jgi:hypothetical protein